MKSILIKDTTREEREQIVKHYGAAAEPNVNSAPDVTTVAEAGSKACISLISTGLKRLRKSTRNIPRRL